MRAHQQHRFVGRAGFTLLELLMAVVIFGIVLAAMNTVFYSAVRLRNRTAEVVDSSHMLDQALSCLRRDLQNIVPPGGTMAGWFKIGQVSDGVNLAQSQSIEFTTTTGVLTENLPWGDQQRVIYQLREPRYRTGSNDLELVRSVRRNLLATAIEEPVEQTLLTSVDTLEFLGFTGSEWRTTWDTTATETNLPTAVRVRIQMLAAAQLDTRSRQPIELLVPLSRQGMSTNATASGGQP